MLAHKININEWAAEWALPNCKKLHDLYYFYEKKVALISTVYKYTNEFCNICATHCGK